MSWRTPPPGPCPICNRRTSHRGLHRCNPRDLSNLDRRHRNASFEAELAEPDPWTYDEGQRLYEGLVLIFEEEAA